MTTQETSELVVCELTQPEVEHMRKTEDATTAADYDDTTAGDDEVIELA